MGWAEFTRRACHPWWRPHSDCALVTLVNRLCEPRAHNPWNLTPATLANQVAPRLRSLNSGTWARLRQQEQPVSAAAAGAGARAGDAWPADADVVARMSVLRLFNDRLLGALPFIDLTRIYQQPFVAPHLGLPPLSGVQAGARASQGTTVLLTEAGAGGVVESPLGGLGLPLGLGEGSDSENEGEDGRQAQVSNRGAPFLLAPEAAAGAQMGELLSSVRGLIFLYTKRRLLRVALRRTVTRPKKAEDDYDYPEDLPQLVLNRPKAVMAKARADPETRLSFSVFGQVLIHLPCFSRATLFFCFCFVFLSGVARILRPPPPPGCVTTSGFRRVAFHGTHHPMDDGQQRTFKVKFEGEGVDDYGGPYRECFSQWCAELQATSTHTDGNTHNDDAVTGEEGSGDTTAAAGREMCILPLLLPCLNRQKGVGRYREKFMLNPWPGLPGSPGAHLYLEMYNFLRQVRAFPQFHVCLLCCLSHFLCLAPPHVPPPYYPPPPACGTTGDGHGLAEQRGPSAGPAACPLEGSGRGTPHLC